ncbi:MAG: triose-phosphate isomerase [Verrucomicrobia bacterium]|nr:triose-phosphate isomerase [Verrucomicrobiota bacterium]MBS0646083.1 triose-phosphate isomerase [Verrucomicrobiota bacterium]
MQRQTLIIGNWKMHKTIQESCAFVKHLMTLLGPTRAQIGLAVPFTALAATAQVIQQLQAPVWLGAQNMHHMAHGAYTGEISAGMLLEAGAKFVLLGHSERRHLFHETSALVNSKVKRALEEGLRPIVCIGETEQERNENLTQQVLHKQLLESLEGISTQQLKKLSLAYEPVWAIGTGKVASAEDADQVHHFIRQCLAQKYGEQVSSEIVIQYGGSVRPDNAQQLLAKPDIDGLLIGGASLDPLVFQQIIASWQGVL